MLTPEGEIAPSTVINDSTAGYNRSSILCKLDGTSASEPCIQIKTLAMFPAGSANGFGGPPPGGPGGPPPPHSSRRLQGGPPPPERVGSEVPLGQTRLGGYGRSDSARVRRPSAALIARLA